MNLSELMEFEAGLYVKFCKEGAWQIDKRQGVINDLSVGLVGCCTFDNFYIKGYTLSEEDRELEHKEFAEYHHHNLMEA